MNASDLAKRLGETVCKVTYKHYKTGELEVANLTLASGYTGIEIVGHDSKSDIIVGYDVFDKAWKSLYMHTITEVIDGKANN